MATYTRTNVSEFFNIDFVKKLYKTYTFKDLDGNEYTCIAETRRKTDKTDFSKLSIRAYDYLNVCLDIQASYEEKTNTYHFPIIKFSVSNITKYLLTIESYVVELAKYKAQKQAEARKAKKQAKKEASTKQVQSVANVA